MATGFWKKLTNKPIFILAPMADVTDVSFRFLLANCMGGTCKPNVIFNEFVSADGLARNKEVLIEKLKYSHQEKPIVAQFFGSKPEYFKISTEIANNQLEYDGIDINMGCPSRKVLSPKQASGAALIKNPELASEIIQSCKSVLSDSGKPVSVKTRIGFDKIEIDEWIPSILSNSPSALSLHLRTKKELSLVPAHWEYQILDKVIEYRNQLSPKTLIIGNGDVDSYEQGIEYLNKFKIDGIMIGRASYGNPWIFNPNAVIEYIPGTIHPTNKQIQFIEQQQQQQSTPLIQITIIEILSTLVKHSIICEILQPRKPFNVLFSHFSNYLKNLANMGDTTLLKKRLMNCNNSFELCQEINNYLINKNKYTDQLLNYSFLKLEIENLINNSNFSQ